MGDTGLTGPQDHRRYSRMCSSRRWRVSTRSHKGGPFCVVHGPLHCENIVGAGLADKCDVQLAYAIGVADPVSVLVDTKNTEKVSVDNLDKLVRKHFPMTPRGIIEHLKLRRPIFKKTAAYGHFGRNEPEFTWERPTKRRSCERTRDSDRIRQRLIRRSGDGSSRPLFLTT